MRDRFAAYGPLLQQEPLQQSHRRRACSVSHCVLTFCPLPCFWLVTLCILDLPQRWISFLSAYCRGSSPTTPGPEVEQCVDYPLVAPRAYRRHVLAFARNLCSAYWVLRGRAMLPPATNRMPASESANGAMAPRCIPAGVGCTPLRAGMSLSVPSGSTDRTEQGTSHEAAMRLLEYGTVFARSAPTPPQRPTVHTRALTLVPPDQRSRQGRTGTGMWHRTALVMIVIMYSQQQDY